MYDTVYPNSRHSPSRAQAEEYQIFVAHWFYCRRCPTIACGRVHGGRIYTGLSALYESGGYGN